MPDSSDIDVEFSYWDKLWDTGDFDWHSPTVNPLLIKHSSHLFFDGERQYKVFVPLCGKSVDMKWFYDKGCTVVGVEYCLKACEDFMMEQEMSYSRKNVGDVPVLESDDKRLRLWCCNLFDFPKLSGEKDFDIVWDRGSYVAVNRSEREPYAELINSIVPSHFRYLLEWYHYDNIYYGGTPRPSTDDEISSIFGKYFIPELLLKEKITIPHIRDPNQVMLHHTLFSPK